MTDKLESCCLRQRRVAGRPAPSWRPTFALVLLSIAGVLSPVSVEAQPTDPDATGIFWVGSSAGLFKIAAHSGEVLLQVPQPSSPSQLAVDRFGGILWAHTDSILHAMDFSGEALFTIPLPVSGAAADLVVNEQDGTVWVAVGSSVMHFDRAGQSLGGFSVPEPVVALGPDRFNRLWIAFSSTVTAFDPNAGTSIKSLDLGKGKPTLADMKVTSPSIQSFDSLVLVGSKGWANHNIRQSSEDGGSWVSLQSGIHSVSGNVAVNDSAIFLIRQNEPWSVASPLETGIIDISTIDGWAWVGGGHQLAQVSSSTGQPVIQLVETLGAGVVVSTLAPNSREKTVPTLALEAPSPGGWLTTNPPTFEFELDDPPGVDDPRISGVDLSTFQLAWVFAENGAATGNVETTCTPTATGAQCALSSTVSEGLNRFQADIMDFAFNRASAADPFGEWFEWETSVDSIPPEVTITAPADGSTVLDRLVPIEISYADPGVGASGLNFVSLEILANGMPWTVTCSKTADQATCSPTEPLPIGAVTVVARIEDVAGNLSASQVDITISGEDTFPPELTILSPESGEENTSTTPMVRLGFTDQGQGIELATLSVLANGAVLPVTCSLVGNSFDGELHCIPDAEIALGPVSLEATISDGAGNTSNLALRSFTIVPPRTVVEGSVVHADGNPAPGARVEVSGKAGAFAFTDSIGAFSIPDVPVVTGEKLDANAILSSGGIGFAAFVEDVKPVYGGTTQLGTLVLQPLCDYHATERFDPPGNRLPGFPYDSFGSSVRALAVFDSGSGPALFAGGFWGGSSTPGFVARWGSSGWDIVAWFDGSVEALAVFDDGAGPALYAGGGFTLAAGSPASGIARWDGTSWSGVDGGVSGTECARVAALEVLDDGSGTGLFAGGCFTSAGGVAADSVALWRGGAWVGVGANGLQNQFSSDPTVNALEMFDDGSGPALHIGGTFVQDDLATVQLNRIAKLQEGSWVPLGSGLNATVLSLSAFDDGMSGWLIAGGEFTTAGGLGTNRVARWDGSQWSVFGSLETVRDLTVLDDGVQRELFAASTKLWRWNGAAWEIPGSEVGGSGNPVFELLATRHSPITGRPALFVGGGFYTGSTGADDYAVGHKVAEWAPECDGTPPSVEILSPTNPATTRESTATLTGRSTDGHSLWLDDQPIPLDPEGSFVAGPLTLSDGNNRFWLTAYDVAGNRTRLPFQVLRDSTAPSISFVAPGAGETVTSSRPRFDLAYSDDHGIDATTIELQLGGAELPATCTAGEGLAACRPDGPLPSGSVTLEALIQDLAGNAASPAELTITVSASSETTVVGTVRLPGGAPATGAEVTVLGQAGAKATAAGDGSFLVPAVSAATPFSLVARYQDASGALTGVVSDVVGVAGGTTDVGPIQVAAPCDVELAAEFTVGVGVDGPAFSDEPRVTALEVFDDASGAGPALFVGGEFTTAGGVKAHGIAKWDGQRWSAVGGGAYNDTKGRPGVVRALRVFDDGSGPALYVGGDFTRFNPSSGPVFARGLARWDGIQWSVVGGSVSGSVFALEVVDLGQGPVLVAGGDFTAIAGVSAKNVARWNGQSWSAFGTGLGLGTDENVYVLAAYKALKGQGQTIYVGGNFNTTGDGAIALSYLAAWDGQKWKALGGGLTGRPSQGASDHLGVYSLTVFQDRLIAGGAFDQADGIEGFRGIGAWDGRAWSKLGTGFVADEEAVFGANGVQGLEVWDDGTGPALYALGGIDLNGESDVLARWDGSSWSAATRFYTGPLSGEAEQRWGAMALGAFDDDPTDGTPARLFVGTTRTQAVQPDGSALFINQIGAWDGVEWSSLREGPPGTIHAMATLQEAGGTPTLFASGTAGDAGGRFTLRWDGETWAETPGFWARTEVGGQDVRHPAHAEVFAVLDDQAGPALYAAGPFEGAGPWDGSGLARWNGKTWIPIPTDTLPGGPIDADSGEIQRIELYHGAEGPALVIAGFTADNDMFVAQWKGSFWELLGLFERAGITCNRAFDGLVEFDDGGGPALFVAGCFTEVGGVQAQYLARWNGSSWSAAGDFDSRVLSLALHDDGTGPALYAVGTFDTVDGIPAGRVARLAGGAWGPVGSGFSHGLSEVGVADTGAGPELWVAGATREIGNPIRFVNQLFRWDGEAWLGLDTGEFVPGTGMTTFDDGTGPGLLTKRNHLFFNAGTITPVLLAKHRRPAECDPAGDTTAPTISFSTPAEGATLVTLRPELSLAYSDSGAGVDPSTLALAANDSPVPADCTLLVAEATCSPTVDLPAGAVTLTATVADAAGNVSGPAQVNITITGGVPALAFTAPSEGAVLTTDSPAVELAYTENADPSTLDLQSAPVGVGFSCTTTATTATCTPLSALPEGSNSLTATVSGFDGSSAPPAQVSFTVDVAPPTLGFSAPADGSVTNQQSPELRLAYSDSGAGVDPATLDIEEGGVDLSVTCTPGPSDAVCTPTSPMPEGVHTLTATIADLAGRTSSAAQVSFEIVLDFEAPAITLSSPQTGAVTTATEIRFTGSLSEPGTLTLDGAPVALDAANAFDHGPVPLAEGWNRFELVATDRVGNTATLTVAVFRDTQPPFLAFLAPLEGSYFDPSVEPIELRWGDSGSGIDPATVQLTANGSPLEAACTACGTGVVCTPATPLTESVVTLQATVTDGAGLTSGAQVRFTTDPNADIVAPEISVTAPVSGSLTNVAEQRFLGALSEPATLTVGGEPATVGANLQFDHGPVLLAEGPNTIELQATDAAGNLGTRSVTLTLDSTPPAPVDTTLVTITGPVGGQVTVSGAAGSVQPVEPGQHVRVENRLTSGAAEASPAADGSFTVVLAAVAGDDLAVATRDSAGNRSLPRLLAVPGSPTLPPDPATVAPALHPTTATGPCDLAGFLVSGADPIQSGVASGAIDCRGAALLRGRVLDRAGLPVPGVRVSVLRAPELGSTLTRGDGAFDLVVHGGSEVIVQFLEDAFLPVHRQVAAPWAGSLVLPDVVLTDLDTAVTAVDLSGSASIQVARGSSVTDADGTRQATLLFPAGTTAALRYPGGAVEAVTTLGIRATEYTVGPDGPAAMPAELPPTSAYTYAVELSADEAVAAGAAGVELDRPVLSYTENFLGLPVGLVIPVGYYDRELGRWIAEENGRVVEILGVTAGLADLDVDGTGAPADAGRLAELGITDAERAQLATLYATGQSLWRVRLTHFSPYDYNLPVFPPAGAGAPGQRPPRGGDRDKKDLDCLQGGSVIECTNQVLGEDVGVTGAPYALHYRSDRVPGRKSARTLEISLSGASPPAGLQRIDLTVDVAGQRLSQSFTPAPDLAHTFTWDGKDTFGRTVQGATEATVSIGYVYDAVYARPPDDELDAFARAGTAALTTNPARDGITLWQRHRAEIGGWDALAQVGLGGWTLSPHHVYDPHSRTLYYGDGGRRTVRDVTTITSAAGNGSPGLGGDDGPAEDALLNDPKRITLSRHASGAPDGGYFIADDENCRIRKVDASGIITTVAGSSCRFADDGIGLAPASGDGGPATGAVLSQQLGQVVQAPDGSLYFADGGYHSIRRVAPDGTISTVIGYDHTHGAEPGPTPGTSFQLAAKPFGLALDDLGHLYVAAQCVFRFQPPDFAGQAVLCQDLQHPVLKYLFEPMHLTLSERGDLYVTDWWANSILRYGWDGSLALVAGGCQDLPGGGLICEGYSGDGGPAASGLLSSPTGLRLTPDGDLLFTDTGNHVLRKVDAAGRISTVAGTGAAGFNGDGRPATQTQLAAPYDLEVLPDGDLLIVEGENHRVRRMEDVLPPVPQTGLILVPEEDGQTRYVFDLDGRHLRTEDARTGEVLLTFAYTPEGRLVSITDAFGNTTTVERDAAGAPSALVAPFGQRTDLTVHPSGYLATIANPAGDSIALGYTADGLLTGLTDPRTNPYTFDYDALGRLRLDTDPATGSTGLTRTELVPAGDAAAGFDITKTTALGRTTTYRTEELTTGDTRLTITNPAGLATVSLQGKDGSRTTTTPDSTVAAASQGPDPRFGMQSPRLESLTVTTPGGLTSTTTATRTATLVNPSGDPKDPANVASVTDTVTVNGKTATSVQDLVARRVTTTSPEGRQSATTFDVFGRATELQVPGAAPVQYGYEARGRLQTITQGTRTTTYTYDAGTGFLTKITDPALREVSFTYDAAGRVKTQTLPDLRVIGFGYDASGNLTSVTPPGKPAHGFTHTPVDLPEAYTPPDIGLAQHATTLTYNPDRQVELVTRPEGQTIDPTYDAASGRLTTTLTPRGSYGYTYDPTTGNLATVTDPDGGSLAFGYDGSLPTSVTWTGEVAGAVGFVYDQDFELVSRTVNGADPVAFGYDQDGLLTSAGALTLSREPASGFLSGTALGNVTDTYGYDPSFAELQTYSAANGGTDLYSVTYTRDDLGRIERKVETLGGTTTTHDYTFDPAGRLTDVLQDGTPVAHYDYDANSNRTAWTDPWGSGTATYDDQDRLINYAGTTYTYTANGELASKSAGAQTVTFDYDVLGALRQVVLADGLTIDYVIDAAGRRVGKKVGGTLVQGFLYQDGLNPVAELDGTGAVVSTFVYGSKPNVPDYLVKAGTTYRVISDHLGSVRLVVNTTDGTVAQRLDYDTFGRITLDTNPGFQPFGFAGGLYDRHTGLVRFGARDYDPETGRWTAKDPILFSGGDSNLYGYVLNDPVNLNDPNGQIVPALLLIWGAVETGLTIWDVIDAGTTLLDPCASGLDKGLSAGGLLAGAVLPGGGYGTLAKKGTKAARRGQRAVIGKLKDLQNLAPHENSLLKHLPNQGTAKRNWAQNSAVLRREMAKGQPIRDASVLADGTPRDNTGFLRAERNLLDSSGWRYDASTQLWSPP